MFKITDENIKKSLMAIIFIAMVTCVIGGVFWGWYSNNNGNDGCRDDEWGGVECYDKRG